MSDTSNSDALSATKTATASQSVYGWALVVCITFAALFVASVFTGQFDGAFDRLRSGLVAIGSDVDVDESQNETPQLSSSETGTNPEPEVSVEAPTFDIVRVEPTGEAVMAGLSFPNDRIEIISDGSVIATAKANISGEWALVMDQALPPGGYALSIRTTSADDGLHIASEQQVTISVPKAPTESAIVMLDSAGAPSSVWQSPATVIRPDVEVKSDNMLVLEDVGESVSAPPNTSTSKTIQGEEPEITKPGAIADPLITIEAVEIETDGTLYASGASNPSASVRIYFDDQLVGETTTDAIGRWQLATQHLLPQDTYTVRVDQLEVGSGKVLARRSVPFGEGLDIQLSPTTVTHSSIEAEAKLNAQTAEGSASAQVDGAIETTQVVVVSRGDNLWSISRRLLGRGIRYTTLYDANEDQISNPSEVFPGQVFVIPGQEPSPDQN